MDRERPWMPGQGSAASHCWSIRCEAAYRTVRAMEGPVWAPSRVARVAQERSRVGLCDCVDWWLSA